MGNRTSCADDSTANEDGAEETKPSYLSVVAESWTGTWTLRLTEKQLTVLPEELQTSTKEIRDLIGRKAVAYPMPVGKHSVNKSKKFVPRPTDVIVLTFHKTGTTWCQQMCHQIRTGGHTDFPEITQVMPWIDFAWEINQNLDDDQIANPRLFKSHARLSAVQEGCKYLVTVRDPIKTLISLYNFFRQKFPNPPFPAAWLDNVDNFARCPLWMIDSIWGGNYWEYMVEFYLCRNQSNVLCLPFELMKDDLKAVIPKAAEFMGVDCDDTLVEKVAELSHLDWMSENEDKFSEGWFYEEQLKYGRFDRPPLPPVAKVTKGSKVVPSEETVKLFEDKWAALVAPKTGCATYDDMLKEVTASLEKPGADVGATIADDDVTGAAAAEETATEETATEETAAEETAAAEGTA